MWVDTLLEFSNAQSVAATADSTNVVDLSSVRQVGVGHPLWLVMKVQTAITGTSPTVAAILETDDNAAFSSAVTVASFPVLTGAAGLGEAGDTFALAVPLNNLERYLQVQFTVGGTSPAGNVDVFLTHEQPDSWVALPDAVN